MRRSPRSRAARNMADTSVLVLAATAAPSSLFLAVTVDMAVDGTPLVDGTRGRQKRTRRGPSQVCTSGRSL